MNTQPMPAWQMNYRGACPDATLKVQPHRSHTGHRRIYTSAGCDCTTTTSDCHQEVLPALNPSDARVLAQALLAAADRLT